MRKHSYRLASYGALLALSIAGAPSQPAVAQARATAHNMQFANATEYKDTKGRIVIIGHVTGDLPGILTLALNVAPSGAVTSGEWALNVSFTQFGPPDPDGDGDPSEVLIQRGVIKGSVSSGGAPIAANGLPTSANGLQLHVTGATVQFAAVTAGSGSFTGAGLANANTASGTLNLQF